jgi:hypothetical protein
MTISVRDAMISSSQSTLAGSIYCFQQPVCVHDSSEAQHHLRSLPLSQHLRFGQSDESHVPPAMGDAEGAESGIDNDPSTQAKTASPMFGGWMS